MSRGHEDAGFSLIEVLVAVTILSGSLAGLAMVLPLAMDATRLSRDRFGATMAARQKVEELLSIAGPRASQTGEDVFVSSTAGRFSRRWRVQPIAGRPGLYSVHVEAHRRANAGVIDRTTLVTVTTSVP